MPELFTLLSIDGAFQYQRDECRHEFIEQLAETLLFVLLLSQTTPARPKWTVFQVFRVDKDLEARDHPLA